MKCLVHRWSGWIDEVVIENGAMVWYKMRICTRCHTPERVEK